MNDKEIKSKILVLLESDVLQGVELASVLAVTEEKWFVDWRDKWLGKFMMGKAKVDYKNLSEVERTVSPVLSTISVKSVLDWWRKEFIDTNNKHLILTRDAFRTHFQTPALLKDFEEVFKGHIEQDMPYTDYAKAFFDPDSHYGQWMDQFYDLHWIIVNYKAVEFYKTLFK